MSGVDVRQSALGRPSAEGSSGGDVRQASEELRPALEGSSSGAQPAPTGAASSPDGEAAALTSSSMMEEAADVADTPAPATDAPLNVAAAQGSGASDRPASESSEAPRGVEESDGHFTSTSRSTDGVLVRRDSRGHLSSSLSSKRVS